MLARFSQGVVELLARLQVSLVVSSNSAGRVFMLHAHDNELRQASYRIKKAMGIARRGSLLAIAGEGGVSVFRQEDRLLAADSTLPYAKLFYPVRTYHANGLNLHDLAFTDQGLVAVCTAHNCLGVMDNADHVHYRTLWTPPFLERPMLTDRCHLNGMATDEHGQVRYVSAFSQSGRDSTWREADGIDNGVIMDVGSQRVVADGLVMPHSPRLYRNRLYYLASATEEFFGCDPQTGKAELLVRADGFLRGMDFHGDYAFIGVSRLRKTSGFGFLPIAQKQIRPGVIIVDLRQRAVVGEIVFPEGVEEIFEVRVLTDTPSACLYDPGRPEHKAACITDHAVAWLSD